MMSARSLSPRDGFAARFGARVLVVAAVVGITFLGNLRSQASEIARPAADHRPARAVSMQPVEAVPARARKVADEEVAAADEDALHLVPAIYAWDPDVRFVFFRHVSKWM